MRFSPPAIALSLALACAGSALIGKPQPLVVDPRSAAMAQQAATAQAAGRLEEAVGLYETALAVDPRNRAAYIGLGRVAQKQGLSGKAIRLYRLALALDANDTVAIAGEGEALASKGAIERAKQNLAQVKQKCAGACPEATRLADAITTAQQKPVVQAQAVTPEPKISEESIEEETP